MKTLVLPKRPLPEYVAKHVEPAIELAYGFLCAKYGWQFEDLVLTFSMSARRSVYFDNELHPHKLFGHSPVVSIVPRTKLFFYSKPSLGKFKGMKGEYREAVNVGYLAGIATAIVHELTHHVQFKRGRKPGNKRVSYSELETTANELEFLKQQFPEEYRLVMIEENTRGVHPVHL